MAERLAAGRLDASASDLLGVMDQISARRLSPAEQAVLTSWADAVRGQAEKKMMNQTVEQQCRQAANSVSKEFFNATLRMQEPKRIIDEDAQTCQDFSFLEISGVLFWSVLALLLGGLCLFKLCKK